MKKIDVTGENAIEELQRLQREFATSGLWPILLGDNEELERIEEGLEDSSETPNDILVSSTQLFLANGLSRKRLRIRNSINARMEIGLMLILVRSES